MDKLELRCRALIGGLLNMCSDCLENFRPRAQYMHFFRAHFKKVNDLLRDGDFSEELQNYRKILKGIQKIYRSSPKPTKDTCSEISKKQLTHLMSYGYKPTRDF